MLRGIVVSIVLLCAAGPAPGAEYPPPDYVEREDRSLQDGVEFVKLFGVDLWSVVREPFVMDAESWFKVGTAAVAFAWLYYWDPEIMLAVQENRDGWFLSTAEDVGSFFDPLGLLGETGKYYAAGIAVGYAFKWEKLERVSTDILFAQWVGGLLRQGFVRVVDRSRPNERRGAYDYGNAGTSSPSGHSSTVFQLATVVSHHFPMWYVRVAAYGIATCLAIQRVTVEQHWASDSFLGACYGHAVGRIIVQANDRRGYLVVPTVDPDTGRPGLALQWNF
jgi:membrane-associated phospholipid phosphatase